MASGKHGHTLHIAGSTTGIAAADMGPCDLGTAIVHRACVDYLMVLRGRMTHGHSPVGTRDELERFFRSAWFGILCDADGETLLSELRRLNKKGIKTIHYAEWSKQDERSIE